MNSREQDDLSVRKLHQEVLESLNTRDAERLLSSHTDNIILMEQNMPALVGKQE